MRTKFHRAGIKKQHSAPRPAMLGVFCLLIVLLTSLAAAQDYVLEYSAIGLDGAISHTPDYTVIDLLTAWGIGGAPQESADYSVTTVIEIKGETPSSGQWWMLF